MKTKTLILGLLFTFILLGTLYADNVMFNYQGRVKVQGTLFSGTGNFKFAIVNNAGNITLWSNDETSVGGGEPTASVTISVTDGIFNVMVGNPDAGMSPINRTVFNHPEKIKLRIWFSDGAHGFQQLLPDHHLANIELLGLTTGTDDFTIYVNEATGNDNNNGLSPSKAKKTIQAAVDVLPERLLCNVTIDIADGVYREEINLVGISVQWQKKLSLIGDETWTPSSSGDPKVRVTGNDDDITATKVRDYCLVSRNVYGVLFKGIKFDNASKFGVYLIEGNYELENCLSTENGTNGFRVQYNSFVNFTNCASNNNGWTGFGVTNNCSANFTDCEALNNVKDGMWLCEYCCGSFYSSGNFSHNLDYGIKIDHNSRARFASGYSGHCDYNGSYGMDIRYQSYTEDHTKNTFTGNSTGTVHCDTGSQTYF